MRTASLLRYFAMIETGFCAALALFRIEDAGGVRFAVVQAGPGFAPDDTNENNHAWGGLIECEVGGEALAIIDQELKEEGGQISEAYVKPFADALWTDNHPRVLELMTEMAIKGKP